MNRASRLVAVAAATAALCLSTVACSSSDGTSATPTTAAVGAATGATESAAGSLESAVATAAASADPAAGKQLSIGFFGFAKANSFAQASWAGVQEYAAANNATATFLDSNFDSPTQVKQLQDAATSKMFDVAIVQANDGTAIVPAVKAAIAAGIVVVIDFTPVGGAYDTTEVQVPGTINIVDAPVNSGIGVATLALGACKQLAATPCKVAYMEGFANFPLDTARTAAVKSTLEAGGAELVASVVGGYTPDTGRAAMQNILQAHPDVNVVIGAGSQSVSGAAPLAEGKNILFVANGGGSTQALDGVKGGTWYGVYYIPEKEVGALAAQYGLAKARGETVPEATDIASLTPFKSLVTKENVEQAPAQYSD